MGFLSPAWADQAGQDAQFITFNKVEAKAGATVSGLFLGYHKNGGQYSYSEFLSAYCVLQHMESCNDADFRKLPTGYWDVPAAPVEYYLKNGKTAPETFIFTLVKKNDSTYKPVISMSTEVSVSQQEVPPSSIAQQSSTQFVATIPLISLQTFAMPAVETLAVTPAIHSEAEVQPESKEVSPVVTVKNIATLPLWGVVACALVLAFCTGFGVWFFFKKKFKKDTESLVWHRDLMRKDNENLGKERADLLLEKGKAVAIIAELSADLTDTRLELTEAQQVAQRFDLPEGLMRENFIPFIYLAKASNGRVIVGNNPDSMQLSSVLNHLKTNDRARDFYGIKIAHKIPLAMPAMSAG